jgi:hypothetical protein
MKTKEREKKDMFKISLVAGQVAPLPTVWFEKWTQSLFGSESYMGEL